jgi:hypothetical protein
VDIQKSIVAEHIEQSEFDISKLANYSVMHERMTTEDEWMTVNLGNSAAA